MSDLADAEINLTPLIDVVFVILIMFIIVAPLLDMDQVELAEGPPISQAAPQAQSPIVIHVLKDDTILFNKQPMTLRELALHLQEAKQRFPEAQPQLYQDKMAHFGTYQAVKNCVAAAGFSELDVLLKPE